jgi:hypothetical protein
VKKQTAYLSYYDPKHKHAAQKEKPITIKKTQKLIDTLNHDKIHYIESWPGERLQDVKQWAVKRLERDARTRNTIKEIENGNRPRVLSMPTNRAHVSTKDQAAKLLVYGNGYRVADPEKETML